MGNSDRSPVMETAVSLPSMLQANGYTTAAFGKRHLHQGCDRGWDIHASHLVRESPDDNYVQWINKQGLGSAFDRVQDPLEMQNLANSPATQDVKKALHEILQCWQNGLPLPDAGSCWSGARGA